MNTWETVKEFYYEKFDIRGELVDLMASYDILALSASGVSNETISSILNIDIEEVKSEIQKYLGFDGWEHTLEFNPRKMFENYSEIDDASYAIFLFNIKQDGFKDANLLVDVLQRFHKLEKELENEWH